MKHTKGEWEVTQMGNVIHKETGKMICATQSAFKEDMDNAKLIAEAPNLLKALMQIEQFSDVGDDFKAVCIIKSIATNAIKKATL